MLSLKKGYSIYKQLGWGKFKEKLHDFISFKIKMRNGYFVHTTAILKHRSLISIGQYADIQEYVIIKTFKNPVEIGKNTQINPFTVIYGGSGIKIGDNVMIAPHCMIASGNHNYKQLEKQMMFADDLSKDPIIIENGVWIGANSTITAGVIIGHDAVIAANSVVTNNVAPFDIVAGSPAKVINSRIDLSLNKQLTEKERVDLREFYKEKYLQEAK